MTVQERSHTVAGSEQLVSFLRQAREMIMRKANFLTTAFVLLVCCGVFVVVAGTGSSLHIDNDFSFGGRLIMVFLSASGAAFLGVFAYRTLRKP
jgi:hypothetical protein